VSRLALGILLLLLSAAAWGTPSVSRFQIANGLQIIVERVPNAPLTAIEVWVRAGVAHETAETSGVAHLLEHLLFRGAVGSPPDALDSAFENAGGILDASTERDWTRFRASVLPDRWREPLQTLLRSLLNPTLPADALEKERRLILHDEYALHYADPIRPARYALFAERFPNHPYGLPLLGNPDTLARLSVEAVRQFYQAHYRPDRMVVVVVGAVEPDAVRRAAEEVFTSLVGTESLRQGQFSPAHAWGQARFFALTPCVPLSRKAGEGERIAPLSHCVGEGSGVRATESKEAVRGSVSSGVLALALPTPPAQDIDGWLCAEVLRVALAEPYRGLLYAGEPPFGRLQSEYLPRLQGSILAFYALPPVRGGDDWQSQTRQRLERALQQVVAGEQRAALEEARAIALARHTATMRNLLERARWYGLCAALNLPLSPEAFAARLRALPFETVEAFAARLLGETPTPAPAAAVQTPESPPAAPSVANRAVARQRLANGLRVIALSAPDADSVIVQVAVGHTLAESAAAGELTMRMLFGATQNETERTLAVRVARSGGSLRVEWTPAGALITAYARPDSVVNVLSLLKEALFRAEFSEESLQRARQYALYDRRFAESGHAWRLTASLIGGYADESALERVRLSDIRAYYHAHYRPQNAVVAIAGNFPVERLTEFVRLIFGGEWEGGARPALPSLAEQRLRLATVADPRGLHYAGYGWATPIARAADYYALLAWQLALGEGKRARLFVAAREQQGVGYDLRAETWLLHGVCVGVGWLQTGKAPVEERLVRDALTTPLSESEFQRALALLRGEWERLRLNLPAFTAALAWAELSGLGYETVWDAPTRLQSLTRETAERVQARLGEAR
jgi:predicted Zn-dependent peptidase